MQYPKLTKALLGSFVASATTDDSAFRIAFLARVAQMSRSEFILQSSLQVCNATRSLSTFDSSCDKAMCASESVLPDACVLMDTRQTANQYRLTLCWLLTSAASGAGIGRCDAHS